MLSRRNIRIKVMQMLYSLSRDKELTPEDVIKRYHRNIQVAFNTYLYNLYLLTSVTSQARLDQQRRSAKLLPSQEDKAFTDKLTSNPLTESLRKSDVLNLLYRQLHFEQRTDQDKIRKIYSDFAKTDTYKEYLQADDTTATHQELLLKLYKFCINSEVFNEFLEDYSVNWTNDQSLVVGTMKKTIKALPSTENFAEKYQPTDETVEGFGKKMLQYVMYKEEELLGHIEPMLKNWDADRVAVMDMILLKMAVTELILFPSIPTKVTLNEFVEIAKKYSTDKSKDFVNGLLDRLMKKLQHSGVINKEGRGLK